MLGGHETTFVNYFTFEGTPIIAQNPSLNLLSMYKLLTLTSRAAEENEIVEVPSLEIPVQRRRWNICHQEAEYNPSVTMQSRR